MENLRKMRKEKNEKKPTIQRKPYYEMFNRLNDYNLEFPQQKFY